MTRYKEDSEGIDMELYLERQKRTKKEFSRLKKLFSGIDEDKFKIVTPLIEKASFMVVTLEDMQENISRQGTRIEYQNGENQWGTKVNPDVQTYNTMIKNYSSIIKQLIDLLPKNEAGAEEDEFDEFLNNR